ncbi:MULTISPECIES: hypothetical protein [unclassified Microbacterium]|uniref:hypothetical protein n=1 Tax=unclassified Microbacterium TaxID=2609290 RepID=UPI0016055266|nr:MULTISPECIES: hypothetical protein [unclassified Microbacterium]QNA91412.1 hypothetical protein G4G29_01310 [Microbacterium sp. Se63.02b]QYM64580.1 hypothetical protein K1X59_01320 [Microbacterium sp. Se5.02b]
MTEEERGASDAVLILEAVARLLRASPNHEMSADWVAMHAEHLEHAARITAEEAGVPPENLRVPRLFASAEWERALAPILFAPRELETVYQNLGYPPGTATAPSEGARRSRLVHARRSGRS